MKKWVYYRMAEDYYKKSKEELIQEIASLSEIECEDRSFANQCQAGTAIYNINELFSALDDLKEGFSNEKGTKVYELLQEAKQSWDYIIEGLGRINDNERCSKKLMDIKETIR
jgi:hypothetical protein